MLRSMKDINGYTIMDINDESVGKAYDFYFDDLTWTVRYLVVDTGTWLLGKRVLISPLVVNQPDWGSGMSFPINLTKEQIENAPHIDEDKPVSRRYEIQLAQHYQWPSYWTDITFMDAHRAGIHPEYYIQQMEKVGRQQETQEAVLEKTLTAEPAEDTHLRSTKEVTGYYIHAADGDIGHVEDFIVDAETWNIRYMVVDTKNWWPAKKVLISPLWIDDISWPNSKVYVGLTQEAIKNSPEYDPSAPVNRAYETRLYDFYGRPKYWV